MKRLSIMLVLLLFSLTAMAEFTVEPVALPEPSPINIDELHDVRERVWEGTTAGSS